MMGSFSGGSQGDMAATLVNNPIGVLLTPDRHALLASLSDTERQLFYGRVLESVFSNPTYQQLMLSTANYQLDQLVAQRGGATSSGSSGGATTGGAGSFMLA